MRDGCRWTLRAQRRRSGLWGFVAASMIDGETGWKSSLTDGASVLQHARPAVLRHSDGRLRGGGLEGDAKPRPTVRWLTSRMTARAWSSPADGAALLVSDVQGDIAVEAYGRALGEGEEGPAVTVERLEGWGHICRRRERRGAPIAGEALGVDGAFPAFEGRAMDGPPASRRSR